MTPRLSAIPTLLLLTTLTSNSEAASNDATPNSFPSIVSLQTRDHHFCGGVLIAPSWILTPAHCVKDKTKLGDFVRNDIRAVLGEHDLNTRSGKEQKVRWKKVILHPDYKGTWAEDDHYRHDIALIKLRDPLTFNQYVKAAYVSRGPDDHLDREDCVLLGWGINDAGTGKVPILQQVQQAIEPTEECYWKNYTTSGQVCVKDANPSGRGRWVSCQGDSGGPMMCGHDHKTLKGLTSWLTMGCRGTVCTKVSAYIDWIEHHTGPLPINNCYVGKSENYNGDVSVTKGGITCQRWDSQTPHRHSHYYITPEEFIDGVMPENYCRTPLGDDLEPWCYTIDDTKRWDYCDVSKCERTSTWTVLLNTSDILNAGTDANIHIKIYWDDTNAMERISGPQRRGQIDAYSFQMDTVGTPIKIKTWLTGKDDPWHSMNIKLKGSGSDEWLLYRIDQWVYIGSVYTLAQDVIEEWN